MRNDLYYSASKSYPDMRQRDFASVEATKGLSGHCRSAFDFRLRRTRHWRGVALWKPSGPSLCCYTYIATQYQNIKNVWDKHRMSIA